jgi:chromosome segregation ATPase
MLRKLLTDKYQAEQVDLIDDIFTSLKEIKSKLNDEVVAKQTTLEGSYEEIRSLKKALQKKEEVIGQLEMKITDCQRANEGNRQIINKLLNDLDRMQQDIEWYKRTYEKRSFMGYLKEYLFGTK